MTPVTRAVLVFDGDCGICTRLARFAVARVQPGAQVASWQSIEATPPGLAGLGLTARQCADAVQFVDDAGRVHSGAEALARALLTGRPVWRPVGRLLLLPVVRVLAALVYRWVARNRHRLPGGTPACTSGDADRGAA